MVFVATPTDAAPAVLVAIPAMVVVPGDGSLNMVAGLLHMTRWLRAEVVLEPITSLDCS